MPEESLYSQLVTEYYRTEREMNALKKERDIMSTRIEAINDYRLSLQELLSRYGKHICDHYEEDLQEREETSNDE